MKYHIITYGCQMNISDSERISAVLEKIGYKKAKQDEADLIVANMCSVRQSAVDRVYGLAEKFKNKKTILTGCILEKDKAKFAKHFDLILDIKKIKKLPEILAKQQIRSVPRKAILHGSPSYNEAKNCRELNELCAGRANASEGLLVSAYIPIMTGCNNFCSYCVVPYTRGREVSRPEKEIINEIKKFIKSGVKPSSAKSYGGAKEIWLLGQNVNSYYGEISNSEFRILNKNRISNLETLSKLSHSKFNRNSKLKIKNYINFSQLLRIINDIDGDFWIRFTSSHPKDFSDDLIYSMTECEKVTKYLNLPVQSGDDAILKKMNRKYTASHYRNIIKKIRKRMPNICISTDVIVGFPGETKKQFLNTAKLFKEVKYDMAYINKYSPRSGTMAEKMKDSISIKEKKRREKILNEILKKTALENNKKLIGKTTRVLVDFKKGDCYFGKTEEYKTIKINNILKENLIGQFIKVKIIKATPWGLTGIKS